MILSTKRLTIREIRPGDAAALYEVFCLPIVFEHFSDGVRSRSRVDNWVNRTSEQWKEHGTGDLVICVSEKPIGSMIIFPNADGEFELGYVLHPNYWGAGYAAEASRAVLEYAFGTLLAPYVIAIVRISNDRSISVLEKLGFQYRHPEDLGDGIARHRYNLSADNFGMM